MAEYYLQDIVQLPTLEPGTYHIEATMELTNGRTLGPMRRRLSKRTRRKILPHWKNERQRGARPAALHRTRPEG